MHISWIIMWGIVLGCGVGLLYYVGLYAVAGHRGDRVGSQASYFVGACVGLIVSVIIAAGFSITLANNEAIGLMVTGGITGMFFSLLAAWTHQKA